MVTISNPPQPTLQRTVMPGRAGNGEAWLIRATAVLALSAALAGLVVDGVYTGARSTAEILRGDDVVTAVLVAPLLVTAAAWARRGSLLGRLVTAGLLADLVYSYAFYVFGTGFNDLFLLHVAVFSTSLTALVLVVAGIDVAAAAERFRAVRHRREVAVTLGILAVSLAGMWISAAVANAVNGSVPEGSRLVETTAIVHLSLVLDLAVQVPLYGAAAVLIWQQNVWGYVAAFVALVSGIPEQVSYMVGMPMQVAAGVPGAVSFDTLEPVILAVYVAGSALLLIGMRVHAAASSVGGTRPENRLGHHHR